MSAEKQKFIIDMKTHYEKSSELFVKNIQFRRGSRGARLLQAKLETNPEKGEPVAITEVVIELITEILELQQTEKHKHIHIIICATEEELAVYARFDPRLRGKRAFSISKKGYVYLWEGNLSMKVLSHELTHVLLAKHYGEKAAPTPPMLGEMIAQYVVRRIGEM